MVEKWFLGLFISTSSTCAIAQGSSTCQAVYQDAVRNVDVQSRIITENSRTYDKHCERNGTVKSTSTEVDLTVPVQEVEIGFNGSRQEALEKMQQFCKIQTTRRDTFDSFYQVNNRVVVDALRSYNQCIALEGKRVQITQEVTPSRSLVVRVGFNPAEQKVSLNSVQYDQAVATCRTNIRGEKTSDKVTATTGQMTAKRPFSIACERRAETTADGSKKFPRLELLVDTNQGAYAVSLPTEEMLGYDLASANRDAQLVAAREQARLRAEAEALRAKMAGAKARGYLVSMGTDAQVPCGGSVVDHAKRICGASTLDGPHLEGTSGGGDCGYSRHRFSCITFP